MGDLLDDRVDILPGMTLFPGFVDTGELESDLNSVLRSSPLRRMQTMRGFDMSVQTSNCGELGWISDRRGYRYVEQDPLSGNPWPDMPVRFGDLAQSAAALAGYDGFVPDACLINHYRPGNQMGAHQDNDELDFNAPIVSVSMGIEARFFVIGLQRTGSSTPVNLRDGDVLVFGGPARKYFHGVRKLKESVHPRFGAMRWNLTFRKAG